MLCGNKHTEVRIWLNGSLRLEHWIDEDWVKHLHKIVGQITDSMKELD